MSRLRITLTVLALGAGALVAAAPGALADTGRQGATTVTTARGLADTLVSAGITPSGAPGTTVRTRTGDRGLRAAFSFPVTGSTADLSTSTGDILHAGGIVLTSGDTTLEIGKFDIDLSAGTVYATEVDGAAARLAVLDLELDNLAASTNANGATVLRGIGVRLDPQAAAALDATFGLSLPTTAPLLDFGRARVVLAH